MKFVRMSVEKETNCRRWKNCNNWMSFLRHCSVTCHPGEGDLTCTNSVIEMQVEMRFLQNLCVGSSRTHSSDRTGVGRGDEWDTPASIPALGFRLRENRRLVWEVLCVFSAGYGRVAVKNTRVIYKRTPSLSTTITTPTKLEKYPYLNFRDLKCFTLDEHMDKYVADTLTSAGCRNSV